MKWEDFNEQLNETYPDNLKCPSLDVSFDDGGNCRQCGKFTTNVMSNPNWTKGKRNIVFAIAYRLLEPTSRLCSRQCFFDYINDNEHKILEKITS